MACTEGMATRGRLRHKRDYLAPSIRPLINPAVIENLYHFPPKSKKVMKEIKFDIIITEI